MRITNGWIAGLAATAVLSVLMLMKQAAGVAEQANLVQMLTGIGEGIAGMPDRPTTGWLIHLGLGVFVWGALFGVLAPSLPGHAIARGVAFALVVWLLMMLVLFPIAGAGVFGASIGPFAWLVTLGFHLAYGAVLGGVYDQVRERRRPVDAKIARPR